MFDLAKDDTAEQFNIATDDENDNAPELVSESDTEFARIKFRTRHDDSEDTQCLHDSIPESDSPSWISRLERTAKPASILCSKT